MDIKSKDILKQALKAYDGALLIVSHDRDFLDGLVDKFYEFNDGKVREHLETIAEFLENKKMESLHELDRKKQETTEAPAKQVQPFHISSRKSFLASKGRSRTRLRRWKGI